jgi:hypothetical protein
MVNYLEVYIFSNQPTTCPKCGSRSDIILDLSHTNSKIEIHQCLFQNCNYEFIMQFDEDFYNGL